jgi:hypothetical protein
MSLAGDYGSCGGTVQPEKRSLHYSNLSMLNNELQSIFGIKLGTYSRICSPLVMDNRMLLQVEQV